MNIPIAGLKEKKKNSKKKRELVEPDLRRGNDNPRQAGGAGEMKGKRLIRYSKRKKKR